MGRNKMSLEIKNLTKKLTFQNQEQILFENLNITFPEYGMVGIIGQSGCGKSTLLNIIAGLDNDYQGDVLINHQNIKSVLNKKYYRKNVISFLYQNYHLIDFMSVYQNCFLYCKLKGKHCSHKEFERLLTVFELKDYQKKKVGELSGGQKQRVALIRALLCDCPILLCDEPTGALNPENKEKIFQFLKLYSHRHLIIIVSHDNSLVKKYAHYVIDFYHLQHHYQFSKQKYQRYQSSFGHHFYTLIEYVFSSLYHQKNKLIMMMISQIFMISASSLLITGINGFNVHYYQQYAKSLNNNLVTITKKDQKIITLEELKHLNGHYDYTFELGQIKNLQSAYQVLPYPYKLKERELVVNDIFYQKVKKEKKIEYFLNDEQYSFEIIKVIKDNDETANIYYNESSLPEQLREQILDQNICQVYLNRYQDVEAYIKNIDSQYQAICFVQEEYKSYQQMIDLFKIVSQIFIVVSLFASVVLILIILSALFYEERQNYALFLANGFGKRQLYGLLFLEIFFIIIINALLSQILIFITIHFANFLDISNSIFHIPEMFVFPTLYYNQFDLYVLYFVVYLLIGLIVYIFIMKQIRAIRIIELLKEE